MSSPMVLHTARSAGQEGGWVGEGVALWGVQTEEGVQRRGIGIRGNGNRRGIGIGGNGVA